ncbi:GNAT family N-acetyltransferase [Streptococcus ictaluri]|uniref:Acetyltransferase, GNAT family n=1 Tax=Streptococcus ictaluri 707-05 TaxID=764299 RepID=G5K0D6_9STRE|nr:GNAT family N-acetyltransferase [Streptococcus ictaluri]EHI70673.1 acetyltransferase, GNAT family [Streptococcus ictaluri 707-05]
MWTIKSFDTLTTEELFSIYKERIAVFVVEQNCPYPDIDDLDLKALHLFQKDDKGNVMAYCRLIVEEDQVKLGRVLVRQDARQAGLGRHLVSTALKICHEKFPNLPVYAQAQAYLQDFYTFFGFQATSEVYLEDDIPHIDMFKE